MHEHPACGAVDGYKQVTSLFLVRHPRQVLDIHVQEARFIILEGFDLWLNLAGISQRLGL